MFHLSESESPLLRESTKIESTSVSELGNLSKNALESDGMSFSTDTSSESNFSSPFDDMLGSISKILAIPSTHGGWRTPWMWIYSFSILLLLLIWPFVYVSYILQPIPSGTLRIELSVSFFLIVIITLSNWICGALYSQSHHATKLISAAQKLDYVGNRITTECVKEWARRGRRFSIIATVISACIQIAVFSYVDAQSSISTNASFSVFVLLFIIGPITIIFLFGQASLMCVNIVTTLHMQKLLLQNLSHSYRLLELKRFNLSATLDSYVDTYSAILPHPKTLSTYLISSIGGNSIAVLFFLKSVLSNDLPLSAYVMVIPMVFLSLIGFLVLFSMTTVHSQWEGLLENLNEGVRGGLMVSHPIHPLRALQNEYLSSLPPDDLVKHQDRFFRDWNVLLQYVSKKPIVHSILGVDITLSFFTRILYLLVSAIALLLPNFAGS